MDIMTALSRAYTDDPAISMLSTHVRLNMVQQVTHLAARVGLRPLDREVFTLLNDGPMTVFGARFINHVARASVQAITDVENRQPVGQNRI